MINILFCGARWLGMACLKELTQYPQAHVVGAVVPDQTETKWWSDISEEEEIRHLKIDRIAWTDAKVNSGFDLVFSVLHGPIFTQSFIETVRFGIINLHPAPLPAYRGCNGPAHVIMNGEKRFGAALHYVDKGIDTGPIIRQYSLKIGNDETGESLYRRTHALAFRLFKTMLPKILKAAENGNRLHSTAQNDAKAQYYPRSSLRNKEVDLNQPYTKIYDRVRALQFPPFEPAFFVYNNHKKYLKIIHRRITIMPF